MNVQEIENFVAQQDNDNNEEFWGTDKEMAELVMTRFMRAMGLPIWWVVFEWREDEAFRSSSHPFVLETTARKYAADSIDRYKTAPVGSPTAHRIVHAVKP
jgi:hypothetical protein